MFTGLIQEKGTLLSLSRRGSEAEIEVSTRIEGFELGESIAVMGACLSVASFAKERFSAFASKETLDKTGLLGLSTGARVNIERALKIGDPIGGHLVSGHVDARIKVLGRNRIDKGEQFTLALPDGPLATQIAPKGSVAIDGISLTVNDVRGDSFDVMVIPLTLAHTTLGETGPGSTVNIETDVLAKYVAHQLGRGDNKSRGIDIDLLKKSGFMR